MRPFQVTVVLLLLALVVLTEYAANVGARSSSRRNPSRCDANPPESCGRGWFRLDSDHCVRFFSDKKTFDDAESVCQRKGGHLMSVKDETTLSTLRCIVLTNSDKSVQSTSHWVGAKRIKHGSPGFQWTDGSGNVEFPFVDRNKNKDCMYVRSFARTSFRSESLLRITGCGKVHRFACEKTG